ncbi:MAG: ABC transporter ATP-binding protein [Candidatus Shapirobacteria bacterium]
MTKTILEVNDLNKSFKVGGQLVPVLKNFNLKIEIGEFVIVFGPSGCGKSTLLHTVLGMEAPTSGRVIFDGRDLYSMNEDQIVRFRKERVGVVFQQSIWIKSLNVLKNVSFPNRLKGINKEMANQRSLQVLRELGLEKLADQHPSELSSGQQQRVGLARALTIDPIMLVADEPTGNLDTVSGDQLMQLLVKLNQDQGKTILMVTHDLEYLRYATKLVHIIDGELVEEITGKEVKKVSGNLVGKKGSRTKMTIQKKAHEKN